MSAEIGGVKYLARVLCEGLSDDKNSESWMHLMRTHCRSEILKVINRDPEQIAQIPARFVPGQLMGFCITAIADAVLFRRPGVDLADCDSAQREQCCNLITNAFTLISHLVTVRDAATVMGIVYEHPHIEDIIVFATSGTQVGEARGVMCQALRSLCDNLTRQGYTAFAAWTAGVLLGALSNGHQPGEFYSLVIGILQDAEKSKCSLIDGNEGQIFSELVAMLGASRSSPREGEDKAIVGILNLINTIIKIDPSQLSSHAIALTDFLYTDCLFAVSKGAGLDSDTSSVVVHTKQE